MKPSFPFLQLHFVLSTNTRNLNLHFFFPFPFLIYAHPRISLFLHFFFFWLRIPFIFNLSKFPFLPNFYVLFFGLIFFFLAPFQYFFSKKLIKATFQPKREDRQKRKSCIKKRGLKWFLLLWNSKSTNDFYHIINNFNIY